MTTTTLSLTLPLDPRALRAWSQQMSDAASRVEALVGFGRDFFDRSLFDCRVFKDGVPVPGEFDKRRPMHAKILYGTEEERRRGMFISPFTEEDDNTEFSSIRSYTMSTNLWDKVMLPSSGPVRIDNDVVVDVDPNELPYRAFVAGLGVKPCSRIFIVGGGPGSSEHAMFCFPLHGESNFLIVLFGGRYYEKQAHFLQGDPAEYAAARKRQPRNWNEFDAATGGTANLKDWPLHEAPAELAMTSDSSGNLVNPRPVELRDLAGNALQALMRGGWITSR